MQQDDRLPRRDIWLLPLISLATLIIMLAGAELVTRVTWPEQAVNACRIPDPMVGYRYRPNCSSTTKAAEGSWSTNDYNECGYRSPAACGAAPAGSRRIALIGTSLSEGYMIEYSKTIAARLSVDLTAMCGLPVEVQNLGAHGATDRALLLWMDEALRLRPDAVVLVLAPFDLETELGEASAPLAGQAVVDSGGLLHRLSLQLRNSRALLVAQHFLFLNPSIYLPLYLRYGDKADFLRPPFSSNWAERLRLFEAMITEMAERTHKAGVALMFGFVPHQAQLAFLMGQPTPAGIDPTAFSKALGAIAARHGVAFADTSVALRTEPAPEQLYHQVDTHLSGEGQAMAGDYLAQRLAADSGKAFSACNHIISSSSGATP